MDSSTNLRLARCGVLATVTALMAACGGGGGNPGDCFGSEEVCGRPPANAAPAPSPAAPPGPALPEPGAPTS